uniref:Uncharacterized protein n=1 Tax=Knipowitschia caucasica TaxID=637954 RepID=A0AAV2IZ67_KNICA
MAEPQPLVSLISLADLGHLHMPTNERVCWCGGGLKPNYRIQQPPGALSRSEQVRCKGRGAMGHLIPLQHSTAQCPQQQQPAPCCKVM